MIDVRVTRLPHGADLPLPAYQTTDSVGMDLMAAIDAPITLAPGARQLIPTGLAIALPPGHEAQIRPRSTVRWRPKKTYAGSLVYRVSSGWMKR